MPPRDAQEIIETPDATFPSGFGTDWGAYVSPGRPYPVGGLFNPVSEPPRPGPRPAPPIFPTVRILEPGPGAEDSATPGPEALPAVVVDPEQAPTATVYENVPGGIYETNRAPTDWDAVYDQYVILNAPGGDVPFHDNIDWGSVAGTIVGGLFDPFGMGAATTAAFSPPGVAGMQAVPNLGAPATGITGGAMPTVQAGGCPPTGPKYLKYCVATGTYSPLRRRRRRRLLTSSDIKDLSALKSIVGGAALQGAVVQAVRR